ncbi:MAG: hypothetical protein LBR22_05725 [Desulfovibrio sp.]|jgi:hypothetical protein|nr:hypothetical protein [Desulfovibrio sp.]
MHKQESTLALLPYAICADTPVFFNREDIEEMQLALIEYLKAYIARNLPALQAAHPVIAPLHGWNGEMETLPYWLNWGEGVSCRELEDIGAWRQAIVTHEVRDSEEVE